MIQSFKTLNEVECDDYCTGFQVCSSIFSFLSKGFLIFNCPLNKSAIIDISHFNASISGSFSL
jgi:hypothetical protein